MRKYLWIVYLGFLAIACLSLIGSNGIKLLDLLFSIIALACLCLYIFSNKLYLTIFWKAYLLFFVPWEIYVNYLDFKTSPESLVTSAITSLSTVLLLCPLFYSIYLYSYQKITFNKFQTEEKQRNYSWIPHAIGILCLLSVFGGITNKDTSFGFVPPTNDYNKGQNSGVTATYVGAIWYIYFLFKESKK